MREMKSIQSLIHYDIMTKSGLCGLDDNVYSATISFNDINYQIASSSQKSTILNSYMQLLNTMANEDNLQILIENRKIDEKEFAENALLKMQDDGLDKQRKEYNDLLQKQIHDGNNKITSKKYLTFNVHADSIDDAEKVVNQNGSEYIRGFKELGVTAKRVDGYERLKAIHCICNPDVPFTFSYDELGTYRTTKDVISPSELDFGLDKNYFSLNNRYYQILELKNWASRVRDDLINEIAKLDIPLCISLNMQVMKFGDDIARLTTQFAQMEMERDSAEQRALNQNRSYSIAPALAKKMDSNLDLQDELTENNQRLMLTQLFVMVSGETYDEMHENANKIVNIGYTHDNNVFSPVSYQQCEAFNAVLPLGNRVVGRTRTLKTENVATLVPFTSQELMHSGRANYYGVNQLTGNLIMCDRKRLTNPNGWIFGIPGSGKGMFAKSEIRAVILGTTNDQVIVIDPEDEYRKIADEQQLNGVTINVDNRSGCVINALGGESDHIDAEFITGKSNFLTAFFGVVCRRPLSPIEIGIIDRAVIDMYRDYQIKLQDKAYITQEPTLADFYAVLNGMAEPEAKKLALSIQMYVTGSYKMFCGQNTVNQNNRLIVYNIRDTESTIKPLAMLVVLESLWDTIIENKNKGINTWIYIDEIYLLFSDSYARNFIYELYKRARKYGAIITGITQNAEDLCNTPDTLTMISNSEFVVMLAQGESDQARLSEVLNIPEEQLSFIKTTSLKGTGLIYNGNGIVIPFNNRIPKDSLAYASMTTDPEDIKKLQMGEKLS